jgi:hypothetical protein
MTRMSKQGKRRHQSPKRRKINMTVKSGPKKDIGFKEHVNALEMPFAFIPKIK